MESNMYLALCSEILPKQTQNQRWLQFSQNVSQVWWRTPGRRSDRI